MHVLLGLLTAAASLAWALFRLERAGVDLNSFNPYYWVRRRKWQRRLGSKSVHNLADPMDAAALLVVGVATYNTDITRELKSELIELFESEFSVSNTGAAELYSASYHMLREVACLESELHTILRPSKALFTRGRVNSLLVMLVKAAEMEHPATRSQLNILSAIEREFSTTITP